MDGLWSASVVASAQPPSSSGQDTSQPGTPLPSLEDFQKLQAHVDGLSQKMEQQRATSYKRIEELTLEKRVLQDTLEAERAERLKAQQPAQPAASSDTSWASEGWANFFSTPGASEQPPSTGEETTKVDPEKFKEVAVEAARTVVEEDKQRAAQQHLEGLQLQAALQQKFYAEEPELANNPHYRSLVEDAWNDSMALNPDLPMADRYQMVLGFAKRRQAREAQLAEESRQQNAQNPGAWINHSVTTPQPQASPYPSGGQSSGTQPHARQPQARAYTHEDRQRDLMADIQERKALLQKRSNQR